MTTDVHDKLPSATLPASAAAMAFYILITLAVVLASVRAFWPPHATRDTTHEVQ